MLGFEVPSGSAHFVKTASCLPAELELCFRCICKAFRNIAGATGRDLVRNFNAGNTLEGVNDIENANAVAGTEVIDRNAGVYERLKSGVVACGKVENVDIVANARTVCGFIIVAENVKVRKNTLCNAGNVGH